MHRYRQNIGTVAQLNSMLNELTWNVAGHLARVLINPHAYSNTFICPSLYQLTYFYHANLINENLIY